MRIAHISDIHLHTLRGARLSSFFSQRVVGGLNLLLNRGREFPPRVADALFADLERVAPEHLIVSGDVSNLSLPGELALVRDRLRALSLPASEITVVPGNHDAYTHRAARGDLFGQLLSEFLIEPSGAVPPQLCGIKGAYPLVRIRDGVAIVALSTARASLPAMAIGTLGRAQLEATERLLTHPEIEAHFRLVVLHHPPRSPHATWHKRLTDAEAFIAMIGRAGADLVLHGHLHRVCHDALPGKSGQAVPVIGATSSTWLSHDAARRARYHLYEIEAGALASRRTRRYDNATEGFVEELTD